MKFLADFLNIKFPATPAFHASISGDGWVQYVVRATELLRRSCVSEYIWIAVAVVLNDYVSFFDDGAAAWMDDKCNEKFTWWISSLLDLPLETLK